MTLTGAVADIQPGVYTILSANSITNGGGAWEVLGLPSRYVGSVSVADNTLRLSIDRRGSMIILR